MSYGHEWLMGIKLKLFSITTIIPDFHIGNDDLPHIKELKEKLHKLEYDAEKIIGSLHPLIEKAYKKEYEKKA